MQDLEDWLTRPGNVASRMRDLRSRAELTGAALARTLGWPPSKVSRIEAGKQLASPADVDDWADATRVSGEERAELHRLRDEAQAWHLEVRYRLARGMAVAQDDYGRLETDAALVRVITPTVIPGLLQIPGYARSVMAALRDAGLPGLGDLDAATAARLERQRSLYDIGKRFEFLIGEPALRWWLAPPPVMRAQLDRLATALDLPNVRIGVLPFGPIGVGPLDTTDIYVAADGEVTATVETLGSHSFYRGDEAALYARLADHLWDGAAEGDDARRLILAAQQALPVGDLG